MIGEHLVIYRHRSFGVRGTKMAVESEARLHDEVAVAEAVGELSRVAEAAAAPVRQAAVDLFGSARFQLVGGAFVVLLAREAVVVKAISQRQLAATTVHASVHRFIADSCGQRVRQCRADDIATVGLAHLDINDVSDALAVAQSRVVDILHALHATHIQRQQVFACGHDIVDAHLHAAEVGQCRDAAQRLVHADARQRQLRQQRIAISRVFQLLPCGIDPHPISFLHRACSLDGHFAHRCAGLLSHRCG